MMPKKKFGCKARALKLCRSFRHPLKTAQHAATHLSFGRFKKWCLTECRNHPVPLDVDKNQQDLVQIQTEKPSNSEDSEDTTNLSDAPAPNSAFSSPALSYHDASESQPSKRSDSAPEKRGKSFWDRRDFDAIHDIPDESVEKLVGDIVFQEHPQCIKSCKVRWRRSGSFHQAMNVRVCCGSDAFDYILKVPFHGTRKSWCNGDAHALSSEAELMTYIYKNTTIPVPKIIAYDSWLQNSIGAPYILMTKVSGMPATEIWLEKSEIERENAHLDADMPSEEVEERRENFLCSLAYCMSQLQTLEFSQIGAPVFDSESRVVGYEPYWRWHSHTQMKEIRPYGPFESSFDFFKYGVEEAFEPMLDLDPENPADCQRFFHAAGLLKIVSIMFSTSPFVDSCKKGDENETFVLRHDDLDLQNIFVDHNGDITGIIDWDGCIAAPRSVGYSSVPAFLRRDWMVSALSQDRLPYLTWSHERYREMYADAMAAYVGSDSKYTLKSPIYQAAYALAFEDADPRDLTSKILNELPHFRRTEKERFLYKLGLGWPAAEELLSKELPALLEP
ncbi:hypothetical protein BS50DRAFT_629887 [Corynespora cassiicola Philippines]|uniref:Uncharacterized protein n=1 Tax=Corynespora cassiicola Philippines TaxID=1448308 RepID=A0A2T2P261_CORCC|nr:hypothetical protein BS50DRAFT_629887 [Corynespora cassiicola Philippines]